MIHKRAIATALLITPLLAGCALFQKSHLADVKISVPDQLSPEDYGASQLALGREMLDQGLYGQAIIAFRNAQHLPQVAAEAHNGLGVGYAQIGRPDLAERYFKQAVLEDPRDSRYQANLNKFYETVPAVAVKSDRNGRLAAQGSPMPTSQIVKTRGGSAVVRIELPTARAIRVSANEVRIETRTTADPRRRSGTAVATATAANPARHRNPAYPIRIIFSSPN